MPLALVQADAMGLPRPALSVLRSFLFRLLYQPQRLRGKEAWDSYCTGLITAAELRNLVMAHLATWASDLASAPEPSSTQWTTPELEEAFEVALFAALVPAASPTASALNTARAYLFCFGYSSPSEIHRQTQFPDEDLGESSQMVFVLAESEESALECGRAVAEDFVQALFREKAYSWLESGFASWIESKPDVLQHAFDLETPVLTPASGLRETAVALAQHDAASGKRP
ncbi:MAG: hypothetical protein HOW73_49495 [Polyangiaceae bacterium]|nr:hypothetical protein [Polyangiaceae bacterium]